MMGEEEHLRALCQIADYLQRRARTRIVAVDQQVVKNYRAGRYRLDVVLDGRQPQGQIQLIARAVAEPLDMDSLVIAPDSDQDRPVISAKIADEPGVPAQRKMGKQL